MIQSTSKVSLNSRFTQLMMGRKSPNNNNQDNSKSDRVIIDRTHSKTSVWNGGRLGQPNFKQGPRRFSSFWDKPQESNRIGYSWKKQMKRTDHTWDRYSRRTRNDKTRSNQGHPLDPLNYNSERRILTPQFRTYHNRRHQRPFFRSAHRYVANTRNSRRFRPYANHANRGRYGNRFERNPRLQKSNLDHDLDMYFSKTSNYRKRMLDNEIDGYMSSTKQRLDRSIDDYMASKKGSMNSKPMRSVGISN